MDESTIKAIVNGSLLIAGTVTGFLTQYYLQRRKFREESYFSARRETYFGISKAMSPLVMSFVEYKDGAKRLSTKRLNTEVDLAIASLFQAKLIANKTMIKLIDDLIIAITRCDYHIGDDDEQACEVRTSDINIKNIKIMIELWRKLEVAMQKDIVP